MSDLRGEGLAFPTRKGKKEAREAMQLRGHCHLVRHSRAGGLGVAAASFSPSTHIEGQGMASRGY